MLGDARKAGKAVGYLSVPLSPAGGGNFDVNAEVARSAKAAIEKRFGADYVYVLDPGGTDLPKGTGADYMLLWTSLLEGPDGLGDVDFVYFAGPQDFARFFGFDGTNDMAKLDAFYDRRVSGNPGFAKAVEGGLTRAAFRRYYGLRASAAVSRGAHDEWNIVRVLNERRRADARLVRPARSRCSSTGAPWCPRRWRLRCRTGMPVAARHDRHGDDARPHAARAPGSSRLEQRVPAGGDGRAGRHRSSSIRRTRPAGRSRPSSTVADIASLDFARVNPVVGPVYVDGAEPGDALSVTLLSFAPSGWGWTANIPGFGLLADQFRDPALHLWTYDADPGAPAMHGPGGRVPLKPFCGTLGVAPAEPGTHSIVPPRRVGGNLDIRDLGGRHRAAAARRGAGRAVLARRHARRAGRRRGLRHGDREPAVRRGRASTSSRTRSCARRASPPPARSRVISTAPVTT